jgi:hypothetical protein
MMFSMQSLSLRQLQSTVAAGRDMPTTPERAVVNRLISLTALMLLALHLGKPI